MILSLEYIAGFFDGEGTVFMGNRGALEVRITQSVMEPLEAIRATLGYGRIGPVSVGTNSAPCWQWRVCKWDEGVEFLRSIRPFLIVKREEVDIVLAYATERLSLGMPLGHTKKLTDETILLRDETKQKLRTFKKGRSRVPLLVAS